jgi:hypothetical protein
VIARIRAVIQVDAVLGLLRERSACADALAAHHRDRGAVRRALALLFRGLEGFKSVAEYRAARRPAIRTSDVH